MLAEERLRYALVWAVKKFVVTRTFECPDYSLLTAGDAEVRRADII